MRLGRGMRGARGTALLLAALAILVVGCGQGGAPPRVPGSSTAVAALEARASGTVPVPGASPVAGPPRELAARATPPTSTVPPSATPSPEVATVVPTPLPTTLPTPPPPLATPVPVVTPEPTATPEPTPTALVPGNRVTEIRANGFERGIVVAAGSTVTWINRDAATHTVTPIDSTGAPEYVVTGATTARSFATAGEFFFVCRVHPQMQTSVVVR